MFFHYSTYTFRVHGLRFFLHNLFNTVHQNLQLLRNKTID